MKLHSDRFKKLLQAVQELEHFLGNQFLDIEFALGVDLKTHLLQVRKITTQMNWNRGVSEKIDATLQGVQSFISTKFKRALLNFVEINDCTPCRVASIFSDTPRFQFI